MIGLAIGAVAGLGSSILGAVQSANQRKKMNRYLNQQAADNNNYYVANALTDYTQRADSQALLNNLRKNLDARQKRARATAAVTGATNEQLATQKQADANVIANTYNNLSAQGQRYKDNITSQYLNQRNNIMSQRMGLANQQAQSNANFMNNGINVLTQSAIGLADQNSALGQTGVTATNTVRPTLGRYGKYYGRMSN